MSLTVSEKDLQIAETEKVLKEAIESKYESVLIIGFKGEKVLFRHSATLDVITKLGMLEAAKLGMLEAAKMEWYNQWLCKP